MAYVIVASRNKNFSFSLQGVKAPPSFLNKKSQLQLKQLQITNSR